MTYRVFKTAWFARAARKAKISDSELIEAIAHAVLGRAENLGGGVFKKRLNDNRHRSIVLTRASDFWVYVYLFAKHRIAPI